MNSKDRDEVRNMIAFEMNNPVGTKLYDAYSMAKYYGEFIEKLHIVLSLLFIILIFLVAWVFFVGLFTVLGFKP